MQYHSVCHSRCVEPGPGCPASCSRCLRPTPNVHGRMEVQHGPLMRSAARCRSVSKAAPSRLSIKDFGTLSLGLRLGFPALKTEDGAAPSALQQSIQTGELINYSMTGKLPTAYQLDKGKLVGVCWSLFSTYVAPDMAAKIAKGLAGKNSRRWSVL